MKIDQSYQPHWISAKEAAEWLDIKPKTLILWRQTKGLAWTTMGGGRTVMYDRRQIEQILNANSTYAITGEKQLTL